MVAVAPRATTGAPGAGGRAAIVGGPRLAPRADLQGLSADQLIARIGSYEASSASNSYALGLCLRELSQARRYRDELGFKTFGDLLVARHLPSRMTAFKLIQLVNVFSEAEVTQLGGPAKGYALIRWAKRQGPGTDPRQLLAPKARVAGRAVSALSVRDIDRVASMSQNPGATVAIGAAGAGVGAGVGVGGGATLDHSKAAQRTSTALGAELGRLGIAHRMRLHFHPGECVSVHLDPGSAKQLLEVLKGYRKLGRPAKRSGKGVST